MSEYLNLEDAEEAISQLKKINAQHIDDRTEVIMTIQEITHERDKEREKVKILKNALQEMGEGKHGHFAIGFANYTLSRVEEMEKE